MARPCPEPACPRADGKLRRPVLQVSTEGDHPLHRYRAPLVQSSLTGTRMMGTASRASRGSLARRFELIGLCSISIQRKSNLSRCRDTVIVGTAGMPSRQLLHRVFPETLGSPTRSEPSEGSLGIALCSECRPRRPARRDGRYRHEMATCGGGGLMAANDKFSNFGRQVK